MHYSVLLTVVWLFNSDFSHSNGKVELIITRIVFSKISYSMKIWLPRHVLITLSKLTLLQFVCYELSKIGNPVITQKFINHVCRQGILLICVFLSCLIQHVRDKFEFSVIL